jgi:cytochrome c oxidase subunit 3
MSLFSRLSDRSWESPGIHGMADPEDYRPAATTVGLYVYFGVATVLFSLATLAYVIRMGLPGAVMAHGEVRDWLPMPKPPLLWINTLVLMICSVAWEFARRAARAGAQEAALRMTSASGLLGVLFLVGQLLLWRQYQAAGYFLSANPANAFFYLLTALHGLHIAGGLFACARTLGQLGERANETRALRNVRLCAIYWHFLLLVWILLAGLLVST